MSGKIWDCFLLDGEIFVFVASLGLIISFILNNYIFLNIYVFIKLSFSGILRMYRKELKTMDMEACKKLLGNLPTVPIFNYYTLFYVF